jgi:HAD superfamily hydrolase (TIGR01490 family)
MAKNVAIFDLDGTLCTGHIWLGLLKYFKEQQLNMRYYYRFMVKHLPLWIAFKSRLLNEQRFVKAWSTGMATLFRGLDFSEGEQIADSIFYDVVLPTIRPEVMDRLHWHREEGDLVMLASSTLQPLLEGVATNLDLQYVVGSSMEIVAGRYTGRLAGPLCFGEQKPLQVLKYIKELDVNVEWESSYAYADRIYDQFLLEMVGHSVAVHPDETLRAVALEKNWHILDNGNQ